MRPVLALAALGVLVLGSLAACSDDDPLRLSENDRASFALRPQLNPFGASRMLPINVIRLTVVSLPDSAQLMDPVEEVVAPDDPSWNLHLDVPLVGGQPVDVLVFVELINETGGVRTVEWSGIAGPFSLEPGRTTQPPEVDLFRGSLDNLSITGVTVSIESEPLFDEGASFVARAAATGATGTPQFFWSSLEETIAIVDTAAGDSAIIRSLLPGVARIVVEAGPRADTLEVTVRATVASIELDPALDTLDAIGAQASFSAAALDARGVPVPDLIVFAWESADSMIARSLGNGAFEARGSGTVEVRARFGTHVGAAQLHVRQVATAVAIAQNDTTLASGSTLALSASASDANGVAIPGATFAWSSDDGAVASVDAAGLVIAAAVGTTRVRAASAGVQDSVTITVVAGAVASVSVAPASLSFDALSDSACLSATVLDAAGNPSAAAVAWTSTSAGVATVDGAGCVSAQGNGAAFIVATADGIADSAAVTVSQVADSVAISLANAVIASGSSADADAVAYDAGGDAIAAATFAWSSSDESVATVDAAGVITGQLAGSAWIRAAAGAAIDSVAVTVSAGGAVTIELDAGDAQSGIVGQTLADSLAVLVRDGLGNPVPGASVDFLPASGSAAPATALTDAAGVARAAWTLGTAAGAAQLRAAIPGDTVVFNATAEPDAVATVDVQPDTTRITTIGATAQLSATSADQFGNDCGCAASWFSRDTNIATVDGSGLVTAIGNGTTWIMATIGGVEDSVVVEVAAGARTITWTGTQSTDWYDAANWSTNTVPAVDDSVYVPVAVARLPMLSADAEVARYESEPGALLGIAGGVTLTIHGDALAEGFVDWINDATVLVDAPAAIGGRFPNLHVAANATLSSMVTAQRDLRISAGVVSPGGNLLGAFDSLVVDGGTIQMSGASDLVNGGSVSIITGGQAAGTLAGGTFVINGELQVSAPCGEFVSTGTAFQFGRDSARVSLSCPGATSNRFDWLYFQQNNSDVVFFDSDVYAARVTAETDVRTLVGAGTRLTTRILQIHNSTIDGLQIRQETTADDELTFLGNTFTGFGSFNESQLVIVAPGSAAPTLISADFDATAPGTLLDVIDVDGAAPLLEVHVQSATAGGEFRTFTTGGGSAWWSGQPYAVAALAGSGQTGAAFAPLTDSLRADVRDVFGAAVPGATVSWSATAGGGSVSPATATTDATGQVAAEWTLGDPFTSQEATASVSGAASAATFTATSITTTAGATITWTGTVDDAWTNGANWDRGSAPTPADTAFVPVGTPNLPRITAPVGIDGLIVADGAVVTADALLGIGTHLRATRIDGTGSLDLGNAEVYASDATGDYWSEGVVELPSFRVSGQAYLWNRIRVAGDVNVLANGFLELTFGGLETSGNVVVQGDGANLAVFDSLIVGASLQVGGAESVTPAVLENAESIVVTGDFTLAGHGRAEFNHAATLLRVGGNASWLSTESGELVMQAGGIVEVAGDWTQDGPSFHSPEIQVFFNGTGGVQTITNLTPGHGPGQGHFGPVHVSNPAGVVFATPNLIRNDLTADAGVPISADTLVVEGNIVVSGDLTATSLDARVVSVSGALTATTVRAASIPNAGAFAVDSAIYHTPDIETATAPVNAALPYTVLVIEADSALFDGPAAIGSDLLVGGVTTLAGRTTVGGAVRIENATGNLVLGGNTLELLGTDSLSTGLATGAGVLTMTQPLDSLIAHAIVLQGGSTAGLLTDGTIVTHGVAATGTALHASGAHRVVISPPSIGSPFLSMSGASLADGAGARFATLRIASSGFTSYPLTGGVAALRIENDSTGAPVLASQFGAPAPVQAREASLYNVSFTNTPLVIDGTSGQLSLDSLTFQGFDVGLTQLDITHHAAITPFTFTGMEFDSLGTPGDGTYVRATRGPSLVDANLVIDIDDTNLDNGEDFTLDDDATADVRWLNDIPPAPAPATIAWTGTTSADWFDASNWNTGAMPTSSDIVWVYATAPSQPQVAQPDTIAGLYLEDGAEVQLADSLVVTGSVRAGASIVDIGAGVLHVIGQLGTDSISGTLPALIADGVTFAGDSTVVQGDLTLRGAQGTFAQSLLHVTGNVRIEETLALSGLLDVDGALEIQGGRVGAGLQLQAGGTVDVADSLLVGGSGTLVMQDASNLLTVAGNARFSSDFSSDGLLTAGTMRLHGDLYAAGGALHSTGTIVELRAAVDQRVELANSGPLPIQAQLDNFAVIKAGGIVYLESDLYVAGDLTENAGYPVFDTAQVHTVRVEGVIDMGGALTVDSLQAGGSFFNIGNGLSAHTTEFYGSAQLIPASYGFENLVVSGSATWNGSGAISGNLLVSGGLSLNGDIEVAGLTSVNGTIDVGAHQFGGQQIAVNTFGFDMSDPLATLVVRSGGGIDFFQPSASTLVDGTITVEAGANFYSQGTAFRSTGTALVMQGDTLFMDDAGPSAGQGALSGLWLDSPVLVMDSVYVTASITEVTPGTIVDRGQLEGGSWYGELRVAGDIVTPQTSYTLSKIVVAGDLQLDANAMDVDTVEFTGNGQIANVQDPVDFSGIPYSTIVVSGTDVSIGDGADQYLDLNADIIVRGAGVLARIRSNDSGRIGSLSITEGDALTRVIMQAPIDIDDTVHVAAGVFDLGGQSVNVNTVGSFPTALRTTGTGVLEMNDPADLLYIANGDAVFTGGNPDGLLTAGQIEIGTGGGFYSVGEAFVANATLLVHHGDTISMQNAGNQAGQGRLASLQYDSPQLDVIDSLYVDGDLIGGPASMLHDPDAADALVRVTDDVIISGAGTAQMVIGHLALADSLILDASVNWAVDTTEFTGTGQYAPRITDPGTYTEIGYNVVLVTGTDVDFGSSGDEGYTTPVPYVIVRGAASSLDFMALGTTQVGSLIMDGGDASQRVRLVGGPVEAWDSVHVASGVLDLNGQSLTADFNGVAPVALRTTGSGILELDQPADQVYVPNGDVWFEGGQSVLSDGTFWHEVTPQFVVGVGTVSGTFHANGAAYQSSGTYTKLDVDSIVVVDGGPGASQARFDKLEFYSGDLNSPTWIDGHAYVADSLIAAFSFSELNGAPGSQLTVLGGMATGSTYLQMPLLTAHGVLNAYQFGYDVDVTEFAGSGQAISQVLPFDTILVTGSATRTVQIGATDTIARVVLVNGQLSMAGGTGSQMMITDSLVVDGPGAVFDLNGTNMIVGGIAGDGALVTSNGGVIASQIFGYLSLDGSAEFRGGDTEGRLTDGLFYFNGDFYAENGAFQASGNHESYFSGGAASPTIRFATPGATSGSDHFGHLTIATGGVVNIASDIYALGNFDDGSDPTSTIVGSGVETIHSDGWDFGGGLIVQDVTLELNEDLAPAAGATTLFGLTFAGYPSGTGATRMRIRHPGLSASGTLQFDNVDFSATASDPGLYVHAIDSDAAGANPDVLNIVYYFAFTSEPGDFFSRIQEDDGATIGTNTP